VGPVNRNLTDLMVENLMGRPSSLWVHNSHVHRMDRLVGMVHGAN
jgi:hypothetical protein